jgi:hypothetical protein
VLLAEFCVKSIGVLPRVPVATDLRLLERADDVLGIVGPELVEAGSDLLLERLAAMNSDKRADRTGQQPRGPKHNDEQHDEPVGRYVTPRSRPERPQICAPATPSTKRVPMPRAAYADRGVRTNE